VEHYILEQKPQVLHGWFMNLVARFGGRKLAIAMGGGDSQQFNSFLEVAQL
jgi:hypothetical protein